MLSRGLSRQLPRLSNPCAAPPSHPLVSIFIVTFTYLAKLTTNELVHIHIPNSPNAKSNEGKDQQAGSARVRIISVLLYL